MESNLDKIKDEIGIIEAFLETVEYTHGFRGTYAFLYRLWENYIESEKKHSIESCYFFNYFRIGIHTIELDTFDALQAASEISKKLGYRDYNPGD